MQRIRIRDEMVEVLFFKNSRDLAHFPFNNHRVGEIANFQDGHTCNSNVIFHEVTDFETAPCGGGCHSLDFFSAFNAKSFAVAIVQGLHIDGEQRTLPKNVAKGRS